MSLDEYDGLCFQERAQAKEAQLASAVTELTRLKAQHQQLQARNAVLEKLSTIDDHLQVSKVTTPTWNSQE